MNTSGCKIPVYMDAHGTPALRLFKEDLEDGSFRPEADDRLGNVRQYITGISEPIATLTCKPFDHNEHEWNSPTVHFTHGRTMSFYQFMREGIRNHTLHVATTEHNHPSKLQMHILLLKPSASVHVRALVARQFMETLAINQ